MFKSFKGNDSELVIKAANVWERGMVGKIHVSHHTTTSHKEDFIVTIYYTEVHHHF